MHDLGGSKDMYPVLLNDFFLEVVQHYTKCFGLKMIINELKLFLSANALYSISNNDMYLLNWTVKNNIQ